MFAAERQPFDQPSQRVEFEFRDGELGQFVREHPRQVATRLDPDDVIEIVECLPPLPGLCVG